MRDHLAWVGVAGSLPPDFEASDDGIRATTTLANLSRALRSSDKMSSVQSAMLQARGENRDLLARLDRWIQRFAEEATAALRQVNPQTCANLAYFDAARLRIRGRPSVDDLPLRRWVWAVGAGGAGKGHSGEGLARFLQAASDWRNMSLIRGSLQNVELEQELGPFEHGQLIGSRIRFGWGAGEVARELARSAPSHLMSCDGLESLLAYIGRVASSPEWTGGLLGIVPLSDEARLIADGMALVPGELSELTFPTLNSTRQSDEYPFVRVGDLLVPASLESLTSRVHLPTLSYLRRSLSPKQSADVFEEACAQILKRIPGMKVETGGLSIKVSSSDPGEIDVIGVGQGGEKFIVLEAKSHLENEMVPTTPRSFNQGIGSIARQIGRRRSAYEGGAPVLRFGKPVKLRKDAEFIGLGVTLHDYSGSLWRAPLLGSESSSPVGLSVIAVADLALIAMTCGDQKEFFQYLEIRNRTVGSGIGNACDEVDILALFFDAGYHELLEQLNKVPDGHALLVPARDAHPDLLSNMQPPQRQAARRLIAALPRVPMGL